MDKKGTYYALVAAQESSEKMEDGAGPGLGDVGIDVERGNLCGWGVVDS